MLPIELINEILCYAIDKSNYLDFLILNRKIYDYFSKEYEPYLLEVYRRSMILTDRSITVPASGRFRCCVYEKNIEPMIFDNIIQDDDKMMKSLELKLNTYNDEIIEGDLIQCYEYNAYCITDEYTKIGLVYKIYNLICYHNYKSTFATFMGYYRKYPIVIISYSGNQIIT